MSDGTVIPVDAPAFTMDRVAAYGSVTNDMNPIHVDPDFAARSRFGAPIVHGLFVLAPVWEAIEQALGSGALEGAEAEIRFTAPTFVEATPAYAIVRGEDGHVAVEIADEGGKVTTTALITLPGGR